MSFILYIESLETFPLKLKTDKDFSFTTIILLLLNNSLQMHWVTKEKFKTTIIEKENTWAMIFMYSIKALQKER